MIENHATQLVHLKADALAARFIDENLDRILTVASLQRVAALSLEIDDDKYWNRFLARMLELCRQPGTSEFEIQAVLTNLTGDKLKSLTPRERLRVFDVFDSYLSHPGSAKSSSAHVRTSTYRMAVPLGSNSSRTAARNAAVTRFMVSIQQRMAKLPPQSAERKRLESQMAVVGNSLIRSRAQQWTYPGVNSWLTENRWITLESLWAAYRAAGVHDELLDWLAERTQKEQGERQLVYGLCLATSKWRNGDKDAAIATLESLVQSHPDQPELEFQTAVACRAAGQLAQSFRIVNHIELSRDASPAVKIQVANFTNDLRQSLIKAGKPDQLLHCLMVELSGSNRPRLDWFFNAPNPVRLPVISTPVRSTTKTTRVFNRPAVSAPRSTTPKTTTRASTRGSGLVRPATPDQLIQIYKNATNATGNVTTAKPPLPGMLKYAKRQESAAEQDGDKLLSELDAATSHALEKYPHDGDLTALLALVQLSRGHTAAALKSIDAWEQIPTTLQSVRSRLALLAFACLNHDECTSTGYRLAVRHALEAARPVGSDRESTEFINEFAGQLVSIDQPDDGREFVDRLFAFIEQGNRGKLPLLTDLLPQLPAHLLPPAVAHLAELVQADFSKAVRSGFDCTARALCGFDCCGRLVRRNQTAGAGQPARHAVPAGTGQRR